MKKIFILATALMGISSIYAMEQPSRDAEMGNENSNAFDMSELQAAIEDVAYNKNPLTYQDFLENVFGRYSALQNDIILMRQTNTNTDFTVAITGVNKMLTNLISDENFIKFTYLTTVRKFYSADEITTEIFTNLMGYIKANAKTLDPGLRENDPIFLNNPETIHMIKNFIYVAIKTKQEERESFFKILLSKPHLNEEYKAILNGQKYDLSEEFLQELTTTQLNLIRKIIQASIEEEIKEAGITVTIKIDETTLALKVTQKMQSIRTVLPLIIKHFGDLGGFGLI